MVGRGSQRRVSFIQMPTNSDDKTLIGKKASISAPNSPEPASSVGVGGQPGHVHLHTGRMMAVSSKMEVGFVEISFMEAVI